MLLMLLLLLLLHPILQFSGPHGRAAMVERREPLDWRYWQRLGLLGQLGRRRREERRERSPKGSVSYFG